MQCKTHTNTHTHTHTHTHNFLHSHNNNSNSNITIVRFIDHFLWWSVQTVIQFVDGLDLDWNGLVWILFDTCCFSLFFCWSSSLLLVLVNYTFIKIQKNPETVYSSNYSCTREHVVVLVVLIVVFVVTTAVRKHSLSHLAEKETDVFVEQTLCSFNKT